MYKSARKRNQVLKNEKKLKKIHGSTLLLCTNKECNNKVKVTEEESNRILSCSKCMKGYLKK